ncbi:DUF4112 domain-containing protein [Algiphilus sp.]|uniref:DUF4112 domain-containing protein n=1 Tax=Algiphilus sp. TaxID=1872431 RepID=UPI001CA76543|nr:DUF4112 domain-containing protein [Algiphilus sp.]MBY8965433.1 DUF4112 domain-containing protein [Algiphilus acroporae]MCI5062412.1 DUF4112 domain-containing protein [Algiphilus sp.]MCI5104387.1 DUF4112 domain-containing protein [Algiphilus sp.]
MPSSAPTRTDRPSAEQIAAARRFARRAAWFLDSSIRIPVVGIRIGVQPIISLIPVAGDVAGFVVTLGIIGQAVRMKAPPGTLARMAGYAVLDLFVGLVPVAGDAVDFFLRANTRNCALLERHLDDLEGKPSPPAWKRRLGVVLVAAALLTAVWLAWVAGSALIGALFG